MKVRHLLTVMAVVVSALGIAACGSSSKSSSTSTSAGTKTVPAPGASVTFITPQNGATTGRTVTAKVKVKGFKLSANTLGQPAKQGEGNLHFRMDDGKYDSPKYTGIDAQLATKYTGTTGKFSIATKPTITYKNLPPGLHTLVVDLANNDQTATGVRTQVVFSVK
jgi:hypothetical protein